MMALIDRRFVQWFLFCLVTSILYFTNTAYAQIGTPLENGQTIHGLSATTEDHLLYYIDVPENAANVVISISEGEGHSGDADLYVGRGSTVSYIPTDTQYHCRPYLSGSNEVCKGIAADDPLITHEGPRGGYLIRVKAKSTFSNVSLTATYEADVLSGSLKCGEEMRFSASQGDEIFLYRYMPGTDVFNPVIAMAPGLASIGNADLYIATGYLPTDSNYSCRAIGEGSLGKCTHGFISPTSGSMIIVRLKAATSFTNVKLGGWHDGPEGKRVCGEGWAHGKLNNGETVYFLSGDFAQDREFYFDTPVDVNSVKFALEAGEGAEGDPDMYVKLGAMPTDSDYDCHTRTILDEYCGDSDHPLPVVSDRYYVRVKAYTNQYRSYDNFKLTATYTTAGSSGGNVLQNGIPVSGLEADRGDDVVYSIDVPNGASNLVIKTEGGSGDADLYTQSGSVPTDTNYECRPYYYGNYETCIKSNPVPGVWYARVKAYASFSDVTLTASYTEEGSSSNQLSNGQTVRGLSASQGSYTQAYYIDVPAGATDLKVTIAPGSGASGDADLYVKKGSEPSDNSYDCRPYDNGNHETCGVGGDVLPTSEGRYYIKLKAYNAFTNVNLTASYNN